MSPNPARNLLLSVLQLTMYMNLVPLQLLITAVEYDVRTLLIPEKPMISFYRLKREIQQRGTWCSQDLCNVREIKEPCAFAPNFLEEVTTQSGPPEELWEQIDKSNMAAWGFFFFDGKPDRSNSFSTTWREKRVSLSLLGCFIPKTCPQWLKKKQKWRPCS